MKSLFCLIAGFVLPLSNLFADSVAPKDEDTSIKGQLAAFTIHPDFEINLFADESMGIANPVAMHWDAKGRLWVLTTLTYAQLKPGQKVNDKLTILEDTDHDGRADKSTVFVDGLDMPMGFALGYGGVYVGQGPDLLFFEDTDGDDKSDLRKVVLTGFGVGDTHQNISNFTWGPDGCLYFSQGLHAYSRVETPWGIVRGEAAGFFRFHPKILRLEPFCFPSLASQNPCGIGFDKTGAMFVKSNNKELIYVTPGLIPTTHQKNLAPIGSIGSTPGKSMGAEYVESSHLPDWIQNHMVVSGYYSHRVTAFPLIQVGAGYKQVEPVEVLVSSHRSFRPVETRIGPDGAIYVADWFNPIIGHYQASLRHPDRDDKHGRVWRITAKGRELSDRSKFTVNEPEKARVHGLDINKAIGGSARARLDAIVAVASEKSAVHFPIILQALDYPQDKFIDYALEQTVYALAEYWVPAATAGKLEFAKPEHLAFALEKIGGTDAREIATAKLAVTDLKPETRARFAQVLAKTGTADDIRDLLMREHADSAVLDGLIESWATRKLRAEPPLAPRLQELIGSENESVRSAAIELAGLWKVAPLADSILDFAKNKVEPIEIRIPAIHATARIRGKNAIPMLREISTVKETSSTLKRGVVEALAMVPEGLSVSAEVTAAFLAGAEPTDSTVGFLPPFLNRKGGADALASAISKLGEDSFNAETATVLALELQQIGRTESKLIGVLNAARGVQTDGLEYSAELVAGILKAVEADGDVVAGKAIFERVELTCTACHQIGGKGGILGPSLDSVGAGLPLDLIVESVLFPDRQMKEGYFAISVTLKGGATFTGYQEKDQDGVLFLKDTASGNTQPLPHKEIAEKRNVGSLMPAGLTGTLSDEERRDLIAYLASLKG